jgi:hypothetical protein
MEFSFSFIKIQQSFKQENIESLDNISTMNCNDSGIQVKRNKIIWTL